MGTWRVMREIKSTRLSNMVIFPPWCERIQKDQTKTPKWNSSKSRKPPLIADDLQVLCLSNSSTVPRENECCSCVFSKDPHKFQLCFPLLSDTLFVWMDRMDLDMGGIQGSHGRMSHWQYCGVWWMDGIPPLVICIRTNHSSPTNQWSQRSPFFQSSESSVISSVAQFVQPKKNSSPNLQISSTGPCHHVASRQVTIASVIAKATSSLGWRSWSSTGTILGGY